MFSEEFNRCLHSWTAVLRALELKRVVVLQLF